MKAQLVLLSLFSGSLVGAALISLTEERPILVSDLDQLRAEAASFPESMLTYKDGAYVFEVDGAVKLLTDKGLTKQLAKIATQFDALADEEEVSPAKREDMFEDLDKRACSNPPCFNSALCDTYTDCHVCLGAHPTTLTRGRCI